MNDTNILAAILVMAAVTAGLRFLPFVLFSGKGRTPEFIDYLGHVLPHAVMAMLVVYCLKGVSFAQADRFVPDLLACAVVSGTYIWKKNTLISIISGTAVYMVLVQLVF